MALTIHLGAHKTASTHLQYSLRLARGALLRAGVFYADPGALRRHPLPLRRALDVRDRKAMAKVAERLRSAREVYPELLLSEENILGRTRRESICRRGGYVYPTAAARVRRVIALAGGGPVTLFMAVRDPAHFYVSAFSLQFLEGAEVVFDSYLNGRDPAQIGWTGLVTRLTSLKDVERIVLWRYEDYPALRPKLLHRLLPPDVAGLIPEPSRSNEGISKAGYDWFVKRALSDEETDLRVLAMRARTRFPRSAGHEGLRPLPDREYERSARGYALQVERLRGMDKVEFLDP